MNHDKTTIESIKQTAQGDTPILSKSDLSKENQQKNPIYSKQKTITLSITIVAIFSSLIVASGYALTFLPNIEIITMLTFMGGLLFGKTKGTLIGLISSIIYRVFNFYGASLPPLLLVQVLFYTFLGLLGGMIHGTSFRKEVTAKSQAFFCIVGILFASAHLVVSDLVDSLLIRQLPFIVVFLSGIPFTLTNIILNAITFGLVCPLIIVQLDPYLKTKFPKVFLD